MMNGSNKTVEDYIKYDRTTYKQKEQDIRAALDDLSTGMFSAVNEENRDGIFYMLCFCLLVPQSKQSLAEKAVEILREKDYLNNPLPKEEVSDIIHGKVRFQNAKAQRLVDAQLTFTKTDFWIDLKQKFETYSNAKDRAVDRSLIQTRRWLVNTINGFGLKLSGHFMRNIGMRGLAILDIHILRALEARLHIGLEWQEKTGKGKIHTTPAKPITKDQYYTIERKMKEYSEKVELELDELDLLFWSNETGYIGK